MWKQTTNTRKSFSRNQNKKVQRSYRVFPLNGMWYVYHYNIGFSATFKTRSDVDKYLEGWY